MIGRQIERDDEEDSEDEQPRREMPRPNDFHRNRNAGGADHAPGAPRRDRDRAPAEARQGNLQPRRLFSQLGCSACSNPGAAFVCGKCLRAKYCDTQCQDDHFDAHQRDCENIFF
jgi:hypothetical protein